MTTILQLTGLALPLLCLIGMVAGYRHIDLGVLLPHPAPPAETAIQIENGPLYVKRKASQAPRRILVSHSTINVPR